MPLNDRQIRNAKPTEAGKKAKLFDGGGLYLEVTPAGGKIFRLKYRIDGKEKTLTIGKYPSVSLSEARQAAALNTFESIARRWHSDNLRRWKENHAARVIRYLEAEVFPAIGAMQIQEIKAAHIKALLDGIMTRGVHNTAEKIREWTAAVFDYAAMLEITESNPARILRQYIPPKNHERHGLQGQGYPARLPRPCKQHPERAGLQPRRNRTAISPCGGRPYQGGIQQGGLHGRTAGDDAVV